VKSIPAERRRRLTHRALPTLGGLAAVSLVAGAIVGAKVHSGAERAASDFAAAWERGDLRAMHALLSARAQERYPLPRFRRAYERAAATATLTSVDAGDDEGFEDGTVTIPVVVGTRVFGRLRGDLRIPVSGERVEWEPHLVFPELRPGERLRRSSLPPRRATLR
jgi:penicillin-binding protein A